MRKNLRLSVAFCSSICLLLMMKVSYNTATNSTLSLSERREKCEILQRKREKCAMLRKNLALNPETISENLRLTNTAEYTEEERIEDMEEGEKGMGTTEHDDNDGDYSENDAATLEYDEDSDVDTEDYEDEDEESESETDEPSINQNALTFFAELESITESGQMAVLCHGQLETENGSISWSAQLMDTQSREFKLLSENFSRTLPESMTSTNFKSAFSHAKVASFSLTQEGVHVSFWMFFDRAKLQDVEEDLLDGELKTFQSFLRNHLEVNPLNHLESLKVSDIVPVGTYRTKKIKVDGDVHRNGAAVDWNAAFTDKMSIEFRQMDELITPDLLNPLEHLYPRLPCSVKLDSLSELNIWFSMHTKTRGHYTIECSYDELVKFDPRLTVSTGVKKLRSDLNANTTSNGMQQYQLTEQPYNEEMQSLNISTSSMLMKNDRFVPWNESFRYPTQNDQNIVKSALYEALVKANLKSHLLGISDVKFNNQRSRVVTYVTMKFSYVTLDQKQLFSGEINKENIVSKIDEYLVKPFGIQMMQYI